MKLMIMRILADAICYASFTTYLITAEYYIAAFGVAAFGIFYLHRAIQTIVSVIEPCDSDYDEGIYSDNAQ